MSSLGPHAPVPRPRHLSDAAAELAAWRTSRGVQLDITGLPGADALSSKVRLPLPAGLLYACGAPMGGLSWKSLAVKEGKQSKKARQKQVLFVLLQERALCASQRLLPSQYLAHKASLLREAQRHGGWLSKEQATSLFPLDPRAGLLAYDLACSAGWLKTTSAALAGASPLIMQVLQI